MTTAYDSMLTDDELLALAVDAGVHWPAPLPTVDVLDAEALRRSCSRGIRSLLVRGALEGDRNPLLAAVATAARAQRCVVAYVGDADGTPFDGVAARAGLLTADGWLLDEILPDGLHRFGRFDSQDALISLVASAATVVHRDGLALTFGEESAFRVSAAMNGGVEAVVISRGRVALEWRGQDASVTRREEVSEHPERVIRGLISRVGEAS